MPVTPQVRPANPRKTAQVRFLDGRIFESPLHTPLADFVAAAYPDAPYPIVAALLDGEPQELSYCVDHDVQVTPVDTSSNEGMRVYQRSLSLVLVVAVRQLYPGARVIIDHSLPMGGFFCEVAGRDPLAPAELAAIEQRMRAIVAADEPITVQTMPARQAIVMFAAQGYDDKVRLMGAMEEEPVTIHSLCGVGDHFYGRMAPSTGKLRYFGLEAYPPGFLLRLPQRYAPTTLPPTRDYPKLMEVFRRYGRWLDILGVSDMGALNQTIAAGEMRKVILVSEALHEKRIAEIADEIVQRSNQVRVVLIAGPSSSGKTTFSRRLAIQLMVNGIRPLPIEMDDYFVDREQTPRDEHGEYDFEAFGAINEARFNDDLARLMAGETVRLPEFDFKAGKSHEGPEVRLPRNAILIIEGIHGLNPGLVSSVPCECVYRIYISALTQLNIDHHNRVPTTDNRLLRRIVRDAAYRGYSAQDTIGRWESVRRGEDRNIFPYQENADVMFNSALAYELAVLKPFAEPLLLRVPHGSMQGIEAQRLLSFLRWVRPCPPDLVPTNSLLREFIGGSILSDWSL
ncbi:MAG: nucleoside kinase [Chloroflexota bacterium]